MIKETVIGLLSQGVCVSECPKMTGVVSCNPTSKMVDNPACNAVVGTDG